MWERTVTGKHVWKNVDLADKVLGLASRKRSIGTPGSWWNVLKAAEEGKNQHEHMAVYELKLKLVGKVRMAAMKKSLH
ncbi:5-methyltetrahydrofolate--homocysteine methyltransferase [Anopheles sinensis]|uniref:5-methyltetrahydrofolate--homocysteine methyltransferase n=1 Tax=Anopheles sinensis TaxID=74873 RepID=A0A084VS28_ANOSI|nr:5-methyltetrahydrofolate--homocysteine methyltransferase [Anopheles sinensis]